MVIFFKSHHQNDDFGGLRSSFQSLKHKEDKFQIKISDWKSVIWSRSEEVEKLPPVYQEHRGDRRQVSLSNTVRYSWTQAVELPSFFSRKAIVQK